MASSSLLNVDDYEQAGLSRLPKSVADYYRSGAGDQQTLRENRAAFSRLRIRPKFLRDVSNRIFNTTVLGTPVSMPICVSPTAMQRMAHDDGEKANARACQDAGVLMTLSTISTTSLEDVMAAAPKGPKWFQLYVFKDRNVTRKLVERAEKAGYRALVLTIDTPLLGNRIDDARNNFSLPPHLTLANFETETREMKHHADHVKEKNQSGLAQYAMSLFDASINWKDIAWLKSITSLPIVVKGVLHADDAILALEHGASAIVVSNHGARQLDGVPATIEALPEVVKAVDGRCEVYLDGGIRTGTDVLKAIALGARAVFIGRPVIYGLSVNGYEGVKHILEILRKEFDLAMALAGCASLDDVRKLSVVNHFYYYPKL